MVKNKKEDLERMEILWRILVLIVTGIILWAWAYLIGILAIVHLFIVLFSGKRSKDLAEFCEYWSSESYRFYRYITFTTNERPFPFTNLKRISKFEK
ncbi:MAG: DUF4389 domain-containing protein [Candidatus Pacearchaeota archaeon]